MIKLTSNVPVDEVTQEWLNNASEIVNKHLQEQMRQSLFSPLIERAYDILLKRGLIMNIEDATPMKIMHDLGYLSAELVAAGNDKAADSLANIAERLAYYFEVQRQEEI